MNPKSYQRNSDALHVPLNDNISRDSSQDFISLQKLYENDTKRYMPQRQ